MVQETNKGIEQDDETGMNEGWWHSVMKDESASSSAMGQDQALADYELNMAHVDWRLIQKLYDSDSIVELNVYGYNRGGLLVEGDHIQGFVPVSHLNQLTDVSDENKRYEILVNYLNKTISLKVIECEPSQRRVVFSERAAQAGEGSRNSLFATLKPGDITSGTVTNITNFGVFIDLGGVEGLIHISELSWGRVQQPASHVQLGQTVRVKVLQTNERSGRIALSSKQLQANPWASIHQRYHVGDHTSATITSVTHFGAFARLQEGIEGLIHISSLQQSGATTAEMSSLKQGEVITVKILHIDSERHRLGLGLVVKE